jgi:hypothetical protein
MKETEIDDLKKLLKDSFPPAVGVELQRDLWPEMLHRLDQSHFHVPWWDWALLGTVIVFFCVFPGALPALLYHL